MSHISVLVIGDNPEKQLASFKNNMDYYEFGDGDPLTLKDGTTAYSAKWKEVDAAKLEIPFAVLKDGDWHEPPDSWDTLISGTKAAIEWEQEFQSLIADITPDTEVYLYDCHI